MRRIHADSWLGLILMAFAGFFLNETAKLPVAGAAQFPRVVLILFFIMAAILFTGGIVRTVKKSGKGDVEINWNVAGKAHIMYALIVAYIAMIMIIGFSPATVIICPAIMVFFGIRRVRVLLLCTVGLTLFIYLLFVVQLRVFLPIGIIFGG